MGRKKRTKERGPVGRAIENLQVALIMGFVRVVAALPGPWIPKLSAAIAWIMRKVDRKGLSLARQNLAVVFGDSLTEDERDEILRESYVTVVQAIVLMLHLQPLTPRKFRRWVDLPEDAATDPRMAHIAEKGAILVSGHVGNWEIMLGLRVMFPWLPPTVFMVEAIPHEAVQRVLEGLRAHGDLMGAMRKGGASVVMRTVMKGGVAAIIADRNIRSEHGGIYVPFLGLPARTSPLPSWLALRADVPMYPLFCFPNGDGRYRIWMGPNLCESLTSEDPTERIVELTTRLNDVLSDVIRAHPGAWNWRVKRFKSRPHPEVGGYPAYSRHDPDSETKRRRYGTG